MDETSSCDVSIKKVAENVSLIERKYVLNIFAPTQNVSENLDNFANLVTIKFEKLTRSQPSRLGPIMHFHISCSVSCIQYFTK